MPDPIPPGHEGLIPHLIVENCTAALEFYAKAFGAVEQHRSVAPDGKRLMHAAMTIDGSLFYLCDDFPEFRGGVSRHPNALGNSPVTITRYVLNVDEVMERAAAAGAVITTPAQDMFWGDRYGTLVDPFGHDWAFCMHIKDVSQEELDEASKKAF